VQKQLNRLPYCLRWSDPENIVSDGGSHPSTARGRGFDAAVAKLVYPFLCVGDCSRSFAVLRHEETLTDLQSRGSTVRRSRQRRTRSRRVSWLCHLSARCRCFECHSEPLTLLPRRVSASRRSAQIVVVVVVVIIIIVVVVVVSARSSNGSSELCQRTAVSKTSLLTQPDSCMTRSFDVYPRTCNFALLSERSRNLCQTL